MTTVIDTGAKKVTIIDLKKDDEIVLGSKKDEISVESHITDLESPIYTLEVTGAGPQGPPGPPGPSAGAFLHTQVTPSDIWTVVHPFNRPVSVTVYDSSGCVVKVAVVQISTNTVEIRANSPFSGVAVIL